MQPLGGLHHGGSVVDEVVFGLNVGLDVGKVPAALAHQVNSLDGMFGFGEAQEEVGFAALDFFCVQREVARADIAEDVFAACRLDEVVDEGQPARHADVFSEPEFGVDARLGGWRIRFEVQKEAVPFLDQGAGGREVIHERAESQDVFQNAMQAVGKRKKVHRQALLMQFVRQRALNACGEQDEVGLGFAQGGVVHFEVVADDGGLQLRRVARTKFGDANDGVAPAHVDEGFGQPRGEGDDAARAFGDVDVVAEGVAVESHSLIVL